MSTIHVHRVRQFGLFAAMAWLAVSPVSAANATASGGLADQCAIIETVTQIRERIQDAWVVPSTAVSRQSALVHIVLGDDGLVEDVTALKASGNSELDESIVDAVRSASPLPVPDDAACQDAMRTLEVKVVVP